jgi:hypothetical protein
MLSKHSRKQAMALGLKRYFTGEPCLHGHIAERVARSGRCLECERERTRKRRAADPEEYREYCRKWRAANRQRAREYQREYRAANLERVRESDRESARRRRAASAIANEAGMAGA